MEEKLRTRLLKVQFLYLEKIDDNSFDIILAIGIFQYLSDKDFKKAFENFNRILSPKGILVATFQNFLIFLLIDLH